MDPWRVYDTTGSDNTHYRNDRRDDCGQKYVKKLYDDSNSDTAHGNRGTDTGSQEMKSAGRRLATATLDTRLVPAVF